MVSLSMFAFIHGARGIFFAFPYGGRVKINSLEICYDTFTENAGEALCQAKGLHYSSFTKGFAYNRYQTERINCRTNLLSSCYTVSHICIEVVNIHCKGPVMTTTSIGCHNNPCQNGGSCHQNSPYEAYHCTCLDGYIGETCENSTIFEPESVVTVGCLDDAWNITLYLPNIRNEYPDLKVNDIYIGQDNENCTGFVNGDYIIFQQEFTGCQTKEMYIAEGINYQNVLVYAVHDKHYHFIVREHRFRLTVNCTKVFPNGPFTNNASIHFDQPLHVQFFSDPSYLHVKTLNSSKVGEKVYVRAYSDDKDSHSKTRLSNCYTTPALSTDPNMVYFIIKNGCVIDPNAILLSQSAHETHFAFQYFEYASNEGSLELHCTATVCQTNELSPACETRCHNSTMKRVGKPF
ncbi:oncoprotein-induced transcript 3 protein-like [Saccostrea echinata]|uniref:oncoprotein-induced transcript 3 protein-like n=1 Tax=Saccostrea echinata TaxID=191078 RepID=UPI002A83F594|nr:oncoprotein-induced transcript 3 protein-like [Saccostrea echinata]